MGQCGWWKGRKEHSGRKMPTAQERRDSVPQSAPQGLGSVTDAAKASLPLRKAGAGGFIPCV